MQQIHGISNIVNMPRGHASKNTQAMLWPVFIPQLSQRDHSATVHTMLLQVFDAKDWDALVMRSIVPKLAWALQDVLVINPLQQDLAPFHWLTAWHAVLPQHHMVNLLEFRFFPAWHRVLHHWLSSQPDFEEVTRWYLGWKVGILILLCTPCFVGGGTQHKSHGL